MAIQRQEIADYLNNSKALILATVGTDGTPDVRVLGGYGVSGLKVFFSTSKSSNKVVQIQKNNGVAILFQHENQVIPNFLNITVYGKAVLLPPGEAFAVGKEVIDRRRPQNVVTEQTHFIYQVTPEQIKVLDFRAATPEERVYTIPVSPDGKKRTEGFAQRVV